MTPTPMGEKLMTHPLPAPANPSPAMLFDQS